jgi:hypothetical protein
MKVVLGKHTLTATREEGDPKIYSESLLLHKIKVELIKQGHDVIKKRMWKDGHLYGDATLQYIRSRNLGKKFQDSHNFIQVYDEMYAVRAMTDEYNKGELELRVTRGDD